MSWVDHIRGTWPANDLRRAFVSGAKWWEFHSTGGTMWSSDQRLAEEAAEKKYPGGQPSPSDEMPGSENSDNKSIAELREEIKTLKEALLPFAKVADDWELCINDSGIVSLSMVDVAPLTLEPYEKARKAVRIATNPTRKS